MGDSRKQRKRTVVQRRKPILQGDIALSKGDVNAEYVVRLSDGTELCAIVSSTGARDLNLGAGDPVWAFFNGFAVVLHIE